MYLCSLSAIDLPDPLLRLARIFAVLPTTKMNNGTISVVYNFQTIVCAIRKGGK